MFYVQANIGRNVSDPDLGPLTAYEWLQFKRSIEALLIGLYRDLSLDVTSPDPEVEFHLGNGVWLDVSEESAHLSILIPVAPAAKRDGYMARVMTSFSRDLAARAHEFGQESIALITGARLVTAKR